MSLVKRALLRVFGPPSGQGLGAFFGRGSPKAGKQVDEYSSLKLSAVFSAIDTISSCYALADWRMYDITKGARTEAIDDPMYRMLMDAPNEYMTSYDMKRAFCIHMLQKGDGFLEIRRNAGAKPVSLHLLQPDWIEPLEDQDTGVFGWMYRVPKLEPRILFDYDVIHWMGPSFDGITGLGRIELAMETISGGLAQDEYGNTFHRNAAMPGGILTRPINAPGLRKRARRRLKEEFNKFHRGLDNAHRVALLEEGTDFKPISFKPEETQFIASKKMTVEDIARYYNIPMHMLKVLDRSTFNNISTQDIGFLSYTMGPHFKATGQQLNTKMFVRSEYGKKVIVHDYSSLQQMDRLSTLKADEIAIRMGISNQDEIRATKGWNPIPDGRGSVFFIPTTIMENEENDAGNQNSGQQISPGSTQ